MPIICKISLDAEEYRQKLAQVVSESKQAMPDLSEETKQNVTVTAETSQAETALPDLSDKTVTVAVKTAADSLMMSKT